MNGSLALCGNTAWKAAVEQPAAFHWSECSGAPVVHSPEIPGSSDPAHSPQSEMRSAQYCEAF